MPTLQESQQTSPASSALSLEDAISRAQRFLLDQQNPHGYWWFTLEANESIGSGTLMLSHFINEVDPNIQRGLVLRLLAEQRSDGSWTLYHNGPGDLSTSVEAYLALRLAGHAPDEEPLRRARRFILSQGGLTKIRIFSRIHLALFGLIPWSACPEMPSWLIALPVSSGFSIYDFSSWARASIVPLLIVLAKKPVRRISFNLDELYAEDPQTVSWKLRPRQAGLSWDHLFIAIDYVLKQLNRFPWHPGREKLLAKCEAWTRQHLERTEDIYPALAYGIMALSALGYDKHDKHMAKAWRALNRFKQTYPAITPQNADGHCLVHPLAEQDANVLPMEGRHEKPDAGEAIHQQCCISPLWDTPWAMTALLASGLPTQDAAIQKSARYLLKHQITDFKGDWAVKNPKAPPGGWAFEFENDFFPDVDDTIQILSVLEEASLQDEAAQQAVERGYAWLLSMQSSNGGWAAFDIDNQRDWVNRIPFSDHGACLDPPTPDITGRVLHLLATYQRPIAPVLKERALDFIIATQRISEVSSLTPAIKASGTHTEPTLYGAWPGRWGVHYLYGTWCVLEGLAALRMPLTNPMIQRATHWLKAVQCHDGGWGESCAGYLENRFVPLDHGVPSQTAWALMALIAAGQAESEAVERGIRFLLQRQQDDGHWDEAEFTGTGFPGYFFIRYHGYRQYFPLLALGRYQATQQTRKDSLDDR